MGLIGSLDLPLNTPMSTFAESIRQFIRNNRYNEDPTFLLVLSQSANTEPEPQFRRTNVVIPDMGLTRLNATGYPYQIRIFYSGLA